MSSSGGRSVRGEVGPLEFEPSGPFENSGLHCRETHAAALRSPVLMRGRLPAFADAAGMFLLCVYPLARGEEFGAEPSDEGIDIALAEYDVELSSIEEREFPRLTPTETEVMNLLAQGKTNRAIAEEMFISINTVKTHIRSIYQKLGVHTRGSAVRLAVAAGLLDSWSPPPSP
ncbi:MAG TPA: helix-turn-helix transcriptional regulator [Bacillota bacterium]|jgi:DNA-binding CsgD family transcriptional regulator|nr:helix-turn-helix transcriptional regulator [Bacillota bacterium]HOL51904.1 helix-turn-helix transcriptional regulator [Bacillota bacterium]